MQPLEIKHFINTTEIRPKNFEDIGFVIDYSQDYNLPELNAESIILVDDAMKLVLSHIASNGVFEGIPYYVEFGDTTLNYYIDLKDSPIISDTQIEVKIKRRKSVEDFMSKAKGLSFDYLATVVNFDLGEADFVVVKDNQGVQLIIFSMNTVFLAIRLAQATSATIESAQDVIKASTPNAGVPPSVDLGDIIAATALLLMRIAYLTLVAFQITNLFTQILDILMPSVKKYKVSKVLDLIEKGCQHLGYEFSSSVISSNLHLLPIPISNETPSIFELFNGTDNSAYTKGYPTAMDATPTLKSLIDEMAKMFNAVPSVSNGVLSLEPYVPVVSTTISNTLNIQSKRENSHTYNSGESWKRYVVRYQFDPSDLHTLNNFQKAQAEYSTEPIDVVNQDLFNVTGVVDINIPFSYGIRKDELNYVESKLLDLAEFADTILNSVGGNGNFASKVNGRIGVMQVSQVQFSNTKLLYLSGTKQPPNYLDFIGAKKIHTYHESNNVKENFKRIYSSQIPLSGHQFKDIVNGGNSVSDSETGEILEIIKLEWANVDTTAKITYAVKSNEGNNTKTIEING